MDLPRQKPRRTVQCDKSRRYSILTANSASGSKYYGITAPEAEYAAVQDQSKRRTVTNVEVTNTSYTMTTYFADDMSVLDTFTIL